MMGPSFTDGRAGVLAIAYRMAQDTHNPHLWKQVGLLENSLKEFYTPNASFGFQTVQVDSSNTYRWIDNPGLWRGATGIALSLLLAQRREESIWDRIFLLS